MLGLTFGSSTWNFEGLSGDVSPDHATPTLGWASPFTGMATRTNRVWSSLIVGDTLNGIPGSVLVAGTNLNGASITPMLTLTNAFPAPTNTAQGVMFLMSGSSFVGTGASATSASSS